MCKNRIYISKIDLLLSQDSYEALLQIISEENRAKCRRFKFKSDSLRTLYGELILRYVLVQQFSFINDEIDILKNEAGKPYIKDVPIHFNISHSGDFVVCAFSEQSVGIDIEQIKEVDLNIAERYFYKCEYEYIFAQEESLRLDYFFLLWTLKESYMKWIGSGMSISLDSFFFEITDTGIFLVDSKRKTKPFFKQILLDGYKISLCSMIENFPTNIEKISMEEMRLGIVGISNL